MLVREMEDAPGRTGDIQLSVVIPVYACAGCLRSLHERLTATPGADARRLRARVRRRSQPRRRLGRAAEPGRRLTPTSTRLRLSRNFGQHAAITAGLAQARGEWAVVMDCDLQEAPEDIPRLWAAAEGGYDVVRTIRRGRRHTRLKRWGSRIYRRLTLETETPPDFSTLSLISRRVIDAFLRLRDRDREYMIALDWLGFDATTIEIDHADRHDGVSAYGLRRLVSVALDGMFFRSTVLLRLVVLAGFVIAAIGLVVAGFEIVDYFAQPDRTVPGYTSLAVLLLVLTGVILISVGVVGLYVGRIFEQVKDRPLYLIDRHAPGPDAAGLPAPEVSELVTGADAAVTRRQHEHLLPAPGNRERLAHAFGVRGHQRVERRLIEALLVGPCAGARIGPAPAELRQQRDPAAREVADRLGDDHRAARGGEHPLHERRRVGQEVVEAGLDDHDIGRGQGLGGAQVTEQRLRAEPAQAGHEHRVDVGAGVGGHAAAQVTAIERARPGAQFEHGAGVGDPGRDRGQSRWIVTAVQDPHDQLVAGRAAVDQARVAQCARSGRRPLRRGGLGIELIEAERVPGRPVDHRDAVDAEVGADVQQLA